MKRALIFGSFLMVLSGSFAQSSGYRIVYRHCLQIDSSRILTDTLGVEAILTGNAENSNYQFGKMSAVLASTTANENLRRKVTEISKNISDYPTKTISTSLNSTFDSLGTMVFWDKKNDSFLVREKMINQYVLTREKNPHIKWTIVDGSRQIGQYQCAKAITEFRGRKYTAWFAPELAIPEGPWKFKGLPGLIMSLEDEDYQVKIYVSSIELSAKDPVPVYQNIGKKVSLNEYMNFFNEEATKQINMIRSTVTRQLGFSANPNAAMMSVPSTKRKYYKIEKRI